MPGASTGLLEDLARDLCDAINALHPSVFNGPNNNANMGRRNSLANRACNAANAIAAGDIDQALDQLSSLRGKIDGEVSPPDWMDDSTQKTTLFGDTQFLVGLLLFE